MKMRMLAGFGLVLFAVAAVMAAEGAKVKLEGVKCIMAASKDAKEANAVDYKGGKVFFCCMNCPKAFSADVAKHAAKANHQLVATGQANHQLVATGQAKQKLCPFSGQAVDTATKITVNGAAVCFCCDKCQAKAKDSKEQIELIFNDKAFEKAGYEVGSK